MNGPLADLSDYYMPSWPARVKTGDKARDKTRVRPV